MPMFSGSSFKRPMAALGSRWPRAIRFGPALALPLLACRLAWASQASWPTYHGGYDLRGVAHGSISDRLSQAWRYRADGPLSHPPIAGDGRIFFTTAKGTVHALDLQGAVAWTRALGASNAVVTFAAPPVLVDGLVVLGAEDGSLHALDADTGSSRWSCVTGSGIQGSPNVVAPGAAVAGGSASVVVLSQAEGVVYATRAGDGAFLWKSGPSARADGALAVSGNRVLFGSCDAAIHVLSASDGGAVARIALGEDCQVAGGVAVHGNRAYVGTRSGALYGVNLDSGTVAWADSTRVDEAFATPAVADDLVLFGASDGSLVACDPHSGVRRWTFTAGGPVLSPVIAGERVIVTAGGTLYILGRESGALLAKQEVGDRVTAPSVAGGLILVGADDGWLIAFGERP